MVCIHFFLIFSKVFARAEVKHTIYIGQSYEHYAHSEQMHSAESRVPSNMTRHNIAYYESQTLNEGLSPAAKGSKVMNSLYSEGSPFRLLFRGNGLEKESLVERRLGQRFTSQRLLKLALRLYTGNGVSCVNGSLLLELMTAICALTNLTELHPSEGAAPQGTT